MVIRAVALHLERTARRANATLDARARTRWLHGCSICAGLNWRVGDGPCRCRAPTRTRPTPTQKVLPAARGVRLGCAWAYSATTITRHGSRAAILGAGAQLKVASFLGHDRAHHGALDDRRPAGAGHDFRHADTQKSFAAAVRVRKNSYGFIRGARKAGQCVQNNLKRCIAMCIACCDQWVTMMEDAASHVARRGSVIHGFPCRISTISEMYRGRCSETHHATTYKRTRSSRQF